jgi:hypothetical protein
MWTVLSGLLRDNETVAVGSTSKVTAVLLARKLKVPYSLRHLRCTDGRDRWCAVTTSTGRGTPSRGWRS